MMPKFFDSYLALTSWFVREFLRKIVPAVALTVAVVLVAAGVTAYYASHNSQCSDPDSISSHVYRPYRLNMIKLCITASVVVDNVLQEADGCYHIRLAFDAPHTNLTYTAATQASLTR